MPAPDSLCLELHVHQEKKIQSDAKEHCEFTSFTNLSHLFEKQLLELSFLYVASIF